MKKTIMVALAIMVVCLWMSAEQIPSTKTAAQMKYIGIAYEGWTEILMVEIKTGTPKDLVISVSAETSLTTRTKITGLGDSSARAAIQVKVEVDGTVVGILNNPNVDQCVVFNDRLLRLTGDLRHADGVDPDHWIEIFMETKSANAFNWFAENVGSGIHIVKVFVKKVIAENGDATALALVGNASVIVDEVNLK